MEIRNARSTSRDDLLGCRAAMLGLDLIPSRGDPDSSALSQSPMTARPSY